MRVIGDNKNILQKAPMLLQYGLANDSRAKNIGSEDSL